MVDQGRNSLTVLLLMIANDSYDSPNNQAPYSKQYTIEE